MLSHIRPARWLPLLFLLAGCADEAPLPLEASGSPLLAHAPAAATLAGPVFALGASPDGSILVAQALQGITELRRGAAASVGELPGVTGVEPIGRGSMFAITSEPFIGSPETSQRLFHISRDQVMEIANLGAFEEAVNPDQVWNAGAPESNPFGIAAINAGSVLVADAAANAILIVNRSGQVDWVAVLTPQANPLEFGPPMIQPVATSVAVGQDGAYYVGELTGFPSPTGMSRLWRIDPGSRHVLCPSDACTLVADGFTSIIDLAFGPDGTLYVVELDEAGWLAMEMAGGNPVDGGTVNACDVESGTCAVVADDLSLPTAVTVRANGQVWIAEQESLFGTSHVHPLP